MNYLLIGEIVKPQGIKGELKVQPYLDDPSVFAQLKTVLVETKAGKEERRVLGARSAPNGVFIFLEKVYTREAAESMRGARLHASRESLPACGEGQYFIADLIGLPVYAGQEHLGRLADVLKLPANDVFEIATEKGSKRYVPFVKSLVEKIVPAEGIWLDAAQLAEETDED